MEVYRQTYLYSDASSTTSSLQTTENLFFSTVAKYILYLVDINHLPNDPLQNVQYLNQRINLSVDSDTLTSSERHQLEYIGPGGSHLNFLRIIRDRQFLQTTILRNQYNHLNFIYSTRRTSETNFNLYFDLEYISPTRATDEHIANRRYAVGILNFTSFDLREAIVTGNIQLFRFSETIGNTPEGQEEYYLIRNCEFLLLSEQ